MPHKKKENQIKKSLEKAQKELMQPAPMSQLTIMLITEYKGYHYMVQQVGFLAFEKRMFQYIIFDKDSNQFYQTYNTISPEEGDPIRMGDIAKITLLMKNMAETTIETIIRKKDPEYKGTEQEEAEIELGTNLVEAMEDPNKAKTLEELKEEEDAKK